VFTLLYYAYLSELDLKDSLSFQSFTYQTVLYRTKNDGGLAFYRGYVHTETEYGCPIFVHLIKINKTIVKNDVIIYSLLMFKSCMT